MGGLTCRGHYRQGLSPCLGECLNSMGQKSSHMPNPRRPRAPAFSVAWHHYVIKSSRWPDMRLLDTPSRTFLYYVGCFAS
jgi:hypothetical protein